tara:strand:+ start:241 stop:492 length:252 start_codon:yes stop_codon:yes gene_type:complete
MTEIPKNDGEYLKLANDLKEQFNTYKRQTRAAQTVADLENVALRDRINRLVEMNTNIEHKNMRLRRMTLVMVEKFTNCCHPLE